MKRPPSMLNGYCDVCERTRRRKVTMFLLFGRFGWPVCSVCIKDLIAAGVNPTMEGERRLRRYLAEEPAFNHESKEAQCPSTRV